MHFTPQNDADLAMLALGGTLARTGATVPTPLHWVLAFLHFGRARVQRIISPARLVTAAQTAAAESAIARNEADESRSSPSVMTLGGPDFVGVLELAERKMHEALGHGNGDLSIFAFLAAVELLDDESREVLNGAGIDIARIVAIVNEP